MFALYPLFKVYLFMSVTLQNMPRTNNTQKVQSHRAIGASIPYLRIDIESK